MYTNKETVIQMWYTDILEYCIAMRTLNFRQLLEELQGKKIEFEFGHGNINKFATYLSKL